MEILMLFHSFPIARDDGILLPRIQEVQEVG